MSSGAFPFPADDAIAFIGNSCYNVPIFYTYSHHLREEENMDEKMQANTWKESGRWLVTIAVLSVFVAAYVWTFVQAPDNRIVGNLALGALSWLGIVVGIVTMRRLRHLHRLNDHMRSGPTPVLLVVFAYAAGIWHLIGVLTGILGASNDVQQAFVNGPLIVIAVMAGIRVLADLFTRLPNFNKG